MPRPVNAARCLGRHTEAVGPASQNSQTGAGFTPAFCYNRRMDGEHCYFLTLEVEPLTTAGVYGVMPLHCTLMHRFFSNLSPSAFADSIRPLIDQTGPLRLRATDRVAFGPHRAMVAVIHASPALLKLHAALYHSLTQSGVRYTETDWVGPGYRPHVSDQTDAAMAVNATVLSQAIYLVEVEHPLHGQKRFIRSKLALITPTASPSLSVQPEGTRG